MSDPRPYVYMWDPDAEAWAIYTARDRRWIAQFPTLHECEQWVLDQPEAVVSAPSIEICIEAYVQMKVTDLWPNGDAPTEVTADAVKALMESSGAKTVVLNDWCLTQHAHVGVLVSHTEQDVELAEVWS